MARAESSAGADEAAEGAAKRKFPDGPFRRFIRDRSAATVVEYGLVVALISVAMIVGLTAFSGTLKTTLLTVSDRLETGK